MNCWQITPVSPMLYIRGISGKHLVSRNLLWFSQSKPIAQRRNYGGGER